MTVIQKAKRVWELKNSKLGWPYWKDSSGNCWWRGRILSDDEIKLHNLFFQTFYGWGETGTDGKYGPPARDHR